MKHTMKWNNFNKEKFVFEKERIGLSNICYTPINKFPQNSLW